MGELHFLDAGNVVLEFLSRLRCFNFRKLFSWKHAVDSSIRTILSSNGNINIFSSSLNCNLSFLKSEGTWEVLIKDGNFAFCIISGKPFFSISIIELDKEVKIWVPLFIIINWDLYLVLGLFLAHSHDLVDMLVVLLSCGWVINRPVSKSEIISSVLDNGNINSSVRLCHRVV